MSQPQFPDPTGRRELLTPGATAHKAGMSLEDRVKALEQGALGRPGPGVSDGSTITSDTSQTGGVGWAYNAEVPSLALHRAKGGPMLAATIDPMQAMSGVGISDGVVYFAALYLPFAATVTGAFWIPQNTGSFTADNNNKVGLYTMNGSGTLTKVAESTNDAATFKTTAGVLAQRAFSSTYSASPGVYYVAMLLNESVAGTNPAPYGVNLTNPARVTLGLAAGQGVAGFRAAQTDLPASTTMTDHSLIRFCGIY